MISRRTFLSQTSLAAFAALEARAAWAQTLPRASRVAIGVQIYMLRTAIREDAAGTLRRIKALGFSQVEWWNWATDLPPARLRRMLDDAGLTAPSAHVDPADLLPDRIDATIERAVLMGHQWLLVAWTPPEQRTKVADWQRLAALLSAAGLRGASAGIRTGYHNHDFDFAPLAGTTPFQILMRETDPAVVDFEVDCYWAHIMGRDPQVLMRGIAPRVRLLHLKDSGPAPTHEMREVGSGIIPWKTLLRTAEQTGVQHAYVEHDRPTEPWRSARQSRTWLRSIGY